KWLQLADRQPIESCSWRVALETAARRHDPYHSPHPSPGRARFLRDESLCRFYGRRRRCCFQSTPLPLKPGALRLRPLPPGWPRSLVTIESGSFSIPIVSSRSGIAKKNGEIPRRFVVAASLCRGVQRNNPHGDTAPCPQNLRLTATMIGSF